MKKSEIVDKISDLYNTVDDQISHLKDILDELRRVSNTLEEMPAETSDIEDDSEE